MSGWIAARASAARCASQVLQRYSSELVTAISAIDFQSLTQKLHGEGLIERETKDDVSRHSATPLHKASIIVSAVERKVEADASLLQEFATLLQDERDDTLKLLANKLQVAYEDEFQRKYREEFMPIITDHSPPPEKPEENPRKIFNAAIEHGHVVVKQRKVLLVGVNGTGKSSLLCLLLKEKPPPVRQSTSCAERPIRAVRLDFTTSELVRMGPKELMAALAKAMRAYNSSKQPEEQESVNDTSPILSLDKPGTSSQHSHVSSDKPTVEKELTSTNEKVQEVDQSYNSRVSSENPTLEKELTTLLGGPFTDEKFQGEVDWTYIIDTGGQPQFMEVLPALLRGTCLTICVFKLSEKLNAHPMVEYYDQGKPICKPVLSSQTNKQFLKHLTSSMKSFRPEGGPSIIFVGTHRDREHECKETREEKERRIFDMVIPALEDSVLFADETLEKFVFAINAKNPEDVDKEVAEDIRRILVCNTPAQTDKLPLQWYGLELKLEERAEALGRCVLTYDECYSAAQELHFPDEKSFKAALHHLSDLNILSYYPDILPNVVFCNPQVLLDKITELVKLNLLHRSQTSSRQHVTHDQNLPQLRAGDFLKFRDWGIVTVELLEDDYFKEHYHHGVFSPSDLVTLFRGLLIFADLGDGTFFMPCLLPWLTEGELSKRRVSTEGKDKRKGKGKWQKSALAPLILKLPDGPQNGLFCSLVSSLISKRDTSPVPPVLEVDISSTSQPVCLKRNCVQLAVRRYPSYITIIDSIDYLEVHVTCPPDYKYSSNLAKDVCNTLLLGLKEAASRIGYSKLKIIEKSFFCPCQNRDPPHLVQFGEGNNWICPKNRIKDFGELKENQKIWLTVTDGKTLSYTMPLQTGPDGAMGGGEEEDLHSPCPKKARLQEPEEAIDGGKEKAFDLAYLSNLPVAAEWERLGLQLGVPSYQLDTIKADHAGQPNQSEHCLRSMFSWWLNNNDSPTPNQLVTALSTIEKRDVAKSIARKYGITFLGLALQDPQRVPAVGSTEEEHESKRYRCSVM